MLEEPAAAAFLLARTEGRRRKLSDDDTQARKLAFELGFLPLALEQAAASIVARRLTFSAYLGLWREQWEKVLTWFDPRVSHYPVSVAATWQTSFDQLSVPARRLLERLAWLAPEPIPESLLEVPIPNLPEPEPDLKECLVELETYSLASRSKEAPTFAIHRLVQDVTRRRLFQSAALRSAEGAVSFQPGASPQAEMPAPSLIEALGWVNDAFVGDPQDVRTWPALEPLAPHARAAAEHADSAGITEPTAQLMNNLAQLLDAKALLGEAEPLMRRALAIDESSYGPEHPSVAIDLNNLAQLLQDTNRLSEAEPLMKRALAIDESSFGLEHPDVARDLNNLAQLLQDTNRLSEAEPLMRRALAIDDSSYGPEHPKVARDLNNLAALLSATNRLSEAEPLMRRVVSIFETSLGEAHPNVAAALNNLAQLLKATNRLSEAEPLMRRALAIDESSYGPEHPDVALDLNNLAQLLQGTNRLSEAEPLIRRVVTIFVEFTRRTGHAHPHLQDAFGNYRALLAKLGKSEEEIETILRELVAAPPPTPQ